MKSEQERPIDKVRYEKPTAVDLGPAAPIVGASCATGEGFDTTGACINVGNSATNNCHGPGNGAAPLCAAVGNSPD